MRHRLKTFEWFARANLRSGAWETGVRCLLCRKPFVGRLFDREVQLSLAGWRKSGPAWTCPRCARRAAREPPPTAECLECHESFGIAHASDEQIESKGWRKVGDAWTCARCAEAIAREGD